MPARTTAASVHAALHDQTRNTMASDRKQREQPAERRLHRSAATSTSRSACPRDADMDADPDQGREDQQSHGASLATCAMAADHPNTARGNRPCSTHRRRTSRSTGSSASRRRRGAAAWWCPRRRARRRPASRCSTPAAMRSTPRWRPRWRSPRTSRGTPVSAASASRWCIAPARSAPRWWISARVRRPPPIPRATS